jgi:hypothetical protein
MMTRIAPTPTSSMMLDTKYGNNINASPQTSGAIDRCFLP